MGNKLSSVFLSDHFISSSLIPTSVDLYFPSLGTLHYQKSLGRGRLMKTILMSDNGGNTYIIKILLLPEGFSIDHELAEFTAMNASLCSLSPHILSQRVLSSPSAGPSPSLSAPASASELIYTVRPYIYTNLYDRLSSRPFLSRIERLWIAYQLLWTLESAHAQGILHGDVKAENVLLTTWNFLYLSDWASIYKPSGLRMDHPSDYLYFFVSNSDGRRACTIAPERFVAATDPSKPCLALTAAMDVFSAGCVLAEIFLDNVFTNQGLFDFQSLLAYRATAVPPHHEHLDKIDDAAVRSMIVDMTALDPASRPSLSLLLNDSRVFPSYFGSFLVLMNQLSSVDLDATARMRRLSSVHAKLEALLPTDTGGEDWVLVISFICSHIRSLDSPTSISLAMQLLLDISKKVSSCFKIALDRILPYFAIFLKSGIDIGGHHLGPSSPASAAHASLGLGSGTIDDSPEIRVKMLAMSSVLELLEIQCSSRLTARGLPKSDEYLFIDYLLPLYVQHCLASPHPLIRSALSLLLPRLYRIVSELSLNPASKASEWKEIRHWLLALLKDADEHVVLSCMAALDAFPLCFWTAQHLDGGDEGDSDKELRHWREELLSHLIATLNNHANRELGITFYTLAPKISFLFRPAGSLVGLKEYLLPLLFSALSAKRNAADERCIFAILRSLGQILETVVAVAKGIEFVDMAKNIMEAAQPYASHPNAFIRGHARRLFGQMKQTCHSGSIESYASLHPILAEYSARVLEPSAPLLRPQLPVVMPVPGAELGLPRSYLFKRDKSNPSGSDKQTEEDHGKACNLEQLMRAIYAKRQTLFLPQLHLKPFVRWKGRSILPSGNSLMGRLYLSLEFPSSDATATASITSLCMLECEREAYVVAGSRQGKICIWQWSDLIAYQSTRPVFSTSLSHSQRDGLGICQLTQLRLLGDERASPGVACIYADSVYVFRWSATDVPMLRLEHQFTIDGVPVLLCSDQYSATLYIVSQEGRVHVCCWHARACSLHAPPPLSVDLSLNALPTAAKLILRGSCLAIGCASGKVRLVDTRFLVSPPFGSMEWLVPKMRRITSIHSLKRRDLRVETMNLCEALHDKMAGQADHKKDVQRGREGTDDEEDEDCLLIAGLGSFPLTLWQRRQRPRQPHDVQPGLEPIEEAAWHCLCVWMTRDEHESNDLSHLRPEQQISHLASHFEHKLPLFTASADYIEKELSGIQHLCLLDHGRLLDLRTNGRLREWRLDAPLQSSLIFCPPRAADRPCRRKVVQVMQPSPDLYCIVENEHREDEQTHHGLALPFMTSQVELRSVAAMLACKMNAKGDWALVLGETTGILSVLI